MDREEPVCPVCGEPVETVVRRHKTLGAWVPVWGPGPCRNPGCAAYGTPAAEEHGRTGSAVEDSGTGTSAGTGTDTAPAPGPAPAPGSENS